MKMDGAEPFMPELPEYSEAEFDKYRADFFQFVVVNASFLLESSEGSTLVEYGQEDILRNMMISALQVGLETNLFRPSSGMENFEIEGLDEQDKQELELAWSRGMPWPIVASIADAYGIDAHLILTDHLKDLRQKLGTALAVSQGTVRVNGEDIEAFVRRMLTNMERNIPEPPRVAEGHNPKHVDRYVLHVEHDGHPCEHSFLGIESAIASAAEGTQNGWLERVHNITLNGVEMMSAQQVAERVEAMLNIGNN